ncbi:hypothetical protein LTR27_009475 [Elasticomyces elasticus]|nr:hypothetical protein LTR27_009475 [Elasticomyces elasticus]
MVRKKQNSQSAAATATVTPFRLLSLPPELWSRICRLAVTRENQIWFSEAMSCRYMERIVKQPAITLVCKTIREETIDLFYANSFVFTGTEKTECNFWIWLHALCIGDRVKYRMPNLSIRSYYRLDLLTPTNISTKLDRIGFRLQRFGEEELALTSTGSWTDYKIVPLVVA